MALISDNPQGNLGFIPTPPVSVIPVTSIHVVDLPDNAVLVVRVGGSPMAKEIDLIKKHFSELFPMNKVAIISDKITLEAVTPTA